MDKQQALALLNDKYHDRKCHTMASMVTNDVVDGVSMEAERKELLHSKFFAAARRHNKSQDEVADLVDLSNFVIDTPVPEAIGEELVRMIEMTSVSRKVRRRDPAIAAATAREKSSRGRGSRTEYILLNPEKELESHEAWDMNFLEDADWSVAMEESAEVTAALKRKTSQTIIDELVAVDADDLNGGAVYSANTAGTWSFDDLVDMRQSMLANYVRPNAMAINPEQTGDLLKEEVFQHSLQYGEFVNKSEGYIGRVLGLDVFETSQLASGNVLMLDTMNTMLFPVRRYSMLESYEEVQDGDKTYGVKVSTRYDLVLGNGKYLSRCADA